MIICHHTLNLSVVLPSIKRGIVTSIHAGQIKEFKENWALLTQDPWVLQTVQWFQLPLIGQLVQTLIRLGINKNTGNDRETGYKYSAVTPEGLCVSDFPGPQKFGGHQLVMNLKALNRFIIEEDFKMEDFHMVKDLVKPGDWMQWRSQTRAY